MDECQRITTCQSLTRSALVHYICTYVAVAPSQCRRTLSCSSFELLPPVARPPASGPRLVADCTSGLVHRSRQARDSRPSSSGIFKGLLLSPASSPQVASGHLHSRLRTAPVARQNQTRPGTRKIKSTNRRLWQTYGQVSACRQARYPVLPPFQSFAMLPNQQMNQRGPQRPSRHQVVARLGPLHPASAFS